jgi:hypothetical protein
MSLTSRLANLFSSGSTNTQRDHNTTNTVELGEHGLPGWKNSTTDIRTGILGSETMAQKAIEEEDRPPYLHVGYTDQFEKENANQRSR